MSARTRLLLVASFTALVAFVAVPAALANNPVPITQPLIVHIDITGTQSAAVDQSGATAMSGNAYANGGTAIGGAGTGTGGNAGNVNGACRRRRQGRIG